MSNFIPKIKLSSAHQPKYFSPAIKYQIKCVRSLKHKFSRSPTSTIRADCELLSSDCPMIYLTLHFPNITHSFNQNITLRNVNSYNSRKLTAIAAKFSALVLYSIAHLSTNFLWPLDLWFRVIVYLIFEKDFVYVCNFFLQVLCCIYKFMDFSRFL